MGWVDTVLLVLLAISILVSVWRGFAREVVSLVSWVAASWVALTFAEYLAPLFASYIQSGPLRLGLAFVLLFVLTLIVSGLLSSLLAQLIEKAGLSHFDRVLGMVFGAARGAVIITVFVLVAGLTGAPQSQWWQDSIVLPHFQHIAVWLLAFLPEDMAQYFHF